MGIFSGTKSVIDDMVDRIRNSSQASSEVESVDSFSKTKHISDSLVNETANEVKDLKVEDDEYVDLDVVVIEGLPKSNMSSTNERIYDDDNVDNERFGGNQNNIICNLEQYIDKEEIHEIVKKYYSEFDKEDLELLFKKMSNIGCSYVAAINTILFEYQFRNPNDFYDKFGFNMHNFDYSSDSNGYSFNYESLFLDFFLYYAKNVRGFNTIEEVYGNIEEQIENGDMALQDNYFSETGMTGAKLHEAAQGLKDYLSEKGIDVDVSRLEYQPGTDEWNELAEMLKKKGIEVSPDQPLYGSLDKELIDYYLRNKGCQIVVSGQIFDLYYPDDLDGNGKLDDIAYEDVGDHAMCIVGTTDDPNKVVVSSWGRKFVMDIDYIRNCEIYDYHR